MTMLRSREIPSVSRGKPPPPKRRSDIIQRSTPAREQEPDVHRSPIEITSDSPPGGLIPIDLPTNTLPRRSPRLAYQCQGDDKSPNGFTEKEVSISVCGKRNSNVDDKFLSLRSGKRVAKRVVDNGFEIDSGELDFENELVHVSISQDGTLSSVVGDTSIRMDDEEKGEAVMLGEVLVVESKNKGKGIMEDSYEDNDVQVKFVERFEEPKGRRKYTREEKGKGIQVEDVNVSSPVTNEIEVARDGVEEMEIEDPVNNQILPDASGDEVPAVVVQPENHHNGGEIGNNSRNLRFRDFAKKHASRFARFDAQVEEEEDLSDKEVEKQVEDWPGPFSTAMKIIKDREEDTNLGFGIGVSSKSPIIWAPRKKHSLTTPLRAPSLQELSLRVLVKNADAITSLDYVPDALRVKLCQLLCESRRMDVHFLDLLVRGSPTEICVPDCSWLTEEQFTGCFKNSDTSNLMVLQLDQCGRCMPDYVLPSTLARSPKNLPMLSSLSLKGACRLSDVGLRALISAAPAIESINLSQCSLLTSSSIDMLSDSLGSVLRELYINECQNIDLKLILSALKKFEKLEVLSLVDLPSVRGRFLREFVTARGQALKQLILTNSAKLTDSSVKAISENCPNLTVLDLANVCKLTDSSLGYLANGCQALEKLIFCRNSFSDEAVAAFVETAGGSLKELSLNNVKKVGHNTASALAKHSEKLQILDLSWCRDMSDVSLGYIVDNCSSLKVLKVFGCTQVTDVFVRGHSSPNVKILGLKMDPFLGHLTKNLAVI
uniref:F-box/LRR-repeat protein 13 n=1 Tax=Noccaea caerulescens TaxID=107243 RepID=A0A1J3CED2_NOCCA